MLLLHANEVVSRDRLIDGLWGERPPPSAGHTLDNYISRLRKALGDARLSRRPPGYILHVESDELDLDRFERLFRDGREAFARGDAGRRQPHCGPLSPFGGELRSQTSSTSRSQQRSQSGW